MVFVIWKICFFLVLVFVRILSKSFMFYFVNIKVFMGYLKIIFLCKSWEFIVWEIFLRILGVMNW